MLSLDWAIAKPLCIFDGKETTYIEIEKDFGKSAIEKVISISDNNGKEVVTENIPYRYKKALVQAGIKV